MALLRCEGVFALPVPSGWTAHGVPGESYLLRPPQGPGEVRLAVFGRGPEPLGGEEGLQRLEDLLAELGVDRSGAGVFVRVRATRAAHRALAWFDGYDADGRDVDCLAAVVLWPGAIIAATAMARPRHEAVLSAAETMVASLAPDRPGR